MFLPGYEDGCVVVGRMVVIRVILALLPYAEILQSGLCVEGHHGPFLKINTCFSMGQKKNTHHT